MKKILMIILVVLVLGMGSYIVYDKINDEECNALENVGSGWQLGNNVDDGDDNNAHWVDYLLTSNITWAKVEYCDNSESDSNGMPKLKKLDLTKDELSQLLLPLKEAQLVKVWLEGTGCGGCCPSLVVNYSTEREDYVFTYDNIKMKVDISDVRDLISSNNDFADAEFLKIIENSDYTLKFMNLPEHSDAGALYSLWKYFDTNIFDLSEGTPLYKIVESKK